MLQKSRGIVLQVTDYAESSIIARIYTDAYGMQSYLVNGVRKKKALFNANLFQPLTLVQLVAYYKPGKSLHRISEISCHPHYANIPYDFIKSSLALFLAEVLYKSIKEEEANERLFNFLFHAFQILDLKTTDCSRFHIFIMGQLTRYLGFYPHGNYSEENNFFNLQDGIYQQNKPLHPCYLDGKYASQFHAMLNSGFEDYFRIELNAEEKKAMLHALLLYYELHLTHGIKFNAHHVLEEVMQS